MRKFTPLVLFVAVLFMTTAAIGQENVNEYELKWSGGYIENALWDVESGFDIDEDGLYEVMVLSDSGGATVVLYEVVALDGQDQYQRVWSANISDCAYSYVLCKDPTDLDGDGLAEIVVGVADNTEDQDAIYIYEWDGVVGSDNYELATSWNLDRNGQRCAVCALAATDIDGDDRQELIVGETRDDWIYFVEEVGGDISFPSWNIEHIDSTLSYSPWGIVTGDFDNDGQNDVAVNEWDYNGLVLIESTAENTYSMEFYTHLTPNDDGVAIRALQSRDLDGNGYDELYCPSTNGRVMVLVNTGDLAAIDTTTDLTQIAYFEDGLDGSFFGDHDKGYGLDGDDLYMGGSDGHVVWDMEFVGDDPTDPASWETYEIFNTETIGDSTAMQEVDGGYDYDGDGEREIFAVTSDDNEDNDMLFVLEHKSSPRSDLGQNMVYQFPPDTAQGLYNQLRQICVNVDTDNDGNMEFICQNHHGGARFYVFENNGDNNYDLVYTSPGEGWYYCRVVTTGDLDGDGLTEIIIAGRNYDNANTIAVYEWNGTAGDNSYTFATAYGLDLTYESGYHEVTDLEVADMDGDGMDELVVCQRSPSGVARGLMIVSETGGDISFPSWNIEYEDAMDRDNPTIPWSPYDVWVGDADNDGNMDAYISYWNYGGGFFYESTGADSYELVASVDEPTALSNLGLDGVSLVDVKGIDMDGDGFLELYSGIYTHSLLCIPVDADIDSTTMTNDSPARLAAVNQPWGLDVGDLDENGQNNVYFTVNGRIYDWEFTGTDVTDPDQYTKKVVADFRRVAHDTTTDTYDRKTDAVFTVEVGNDLDGDGNQELLVGLAPWDFGTYELAPTLYIFEATPTGIEPVWANTQPKNYKLHQNYPNPFNPNTTISYDVKKAGKVTLKVYNTLGQLVKTLVDNKQKSVGTHWSTWDGTNNSGEQVASGVYIYRMSIGDFTATKQMSLVR